MPVLTGLALENFRGFSRHLVPFKARTVVVGPNNAGKSTIAEALRLAALVTTRFGSANFRDVPKWLDLGKTHRGFAPDLDRTEFDFTTAFYRFGDPPAVLRYAFANGTRVEIYIGGESKVHAVTFTSSGTVVQTKSQAASVALPQIAACPQVGPLALDERVLTAEYVRRTQDTPRGSQLLRNQIFRSGEYFSEFRNLVSELWPGIRVRDLDHVKDEPRIPGDTRGALFLLIQEGSDFVAESSRFGHGLQVCLQIAWFLARTHSESCVVLDEPDVYLHPDVQRRLLRVVRARYSQTIVTTHSAEIMADASPDEVLIVNKSAAASQFATTLPAVQEVVDRLGGVHNLSLAKFANARRFLLVEGDDVTALATVHRILFPASQLDLRDLPNANVGGWSGWERVVGVTSAMKNALGQGMSVYAIFDRDYYSATVIEGRYVRAKEHGVRLHVWHRKELENYFLIPAAIARVINERRPIHAPEVTEADVQNRIDQIVDGLRANTVATIAEVLLANDKKAGLKAALFAAETNVASKWTDREARWGLVQGKEVFSSLSAWSQENYACAFGITAVVRAIRADEVVKELVSVLAAIERNVAFD